MATIKHPRYSSTVMEHFATPRHAGVLGGMSGVGEAAMPPARMRVSVFLKGGRIGQISFETDRTIPAVAAGSALCERTFRLPWPDALAYTPEALTQALGGLPEDERFWSDLAVSALRFAITQARISPIRSRLSREPEEET
ncbi:MAG TPA: iron-sulfur cluster assembly scaffold protein [Candidatus Xenobia bacterium]